MFSDQRLWYTERKHRKSHEGEDLHMLMGTFGGWWATSSDRRFRDKSSDHIQCISKYGSSILPWNFQSTSRVLYLSVLFFLRRWDWAIGNFQNWKFFISLCWLQTFPFFFFFSYLVFSLKFPSNESVNFMTYNFLFGLSPRLYF